MLRAASIGMGWWSDELADAAQGKSDAIRIVTCFTRSEEKRAAFAAKYGTAQHDSYEAVLADEAVDAVILTTPHSIHAEQAIAAAAAGKHVFCEKPFTLTRASAQAAVDACAEAGVILAIGQNRRWHSATRALKAMLEAGDFGTVLHAEANFSVSSALSYTTEHWRSNRIESPAGSITGLGIHMPALIAHLHAVLVLMRAVDTLGVFYYSLNRSLPRAGGIALPRLPAKKVPALDGQLSLPWDE